FDADMNEVFKDVEGDAEQVISTAVDEVPTGVSISTAEPITIASVNITTANVNTTTAEPTTPPTTTVFEDEDLIIALTLVKMRSEKSKVRGVVMQEPSETVIRPTIPPQQHNPKDKGKDAISGPNWLFDIDAITNSMNYKPIVAGNQSNGNAGTKACADAGKARVETVPGKDYILLPLWTQDPPFSSSPKDSSDFGFNPSREEQKKDVEDLRNEGGNPSEEGERINQENDASVNSTNNINTVSPT
ncbi:hypothetical protein Tco_0061107, partial [Tanacetum coccineum]